MLLKYHSFLKSLKDKTQNLSPRDVIKKHILDKNHKVSDEDFKLIKISYTIKT